MFVNISHQTGYCTVVSSIRHAECVDSIPPKHMKQRQTDVKLTNVSLAKTT